MAWLESHQTLANHPKTLKLARLLNVPRVTAVGHLHFLWWWALDYAQDGNLGKFDELDIAVAGDWQGEPVVFLDGLKRAGFVDDDGTIHDWNEYAGRLIDRRRADAERKRDARTPKSAPRPQPSTPRPVDVQRTSSGHPEDGVRNPTVHNTTEPDTTEPKTTQPPKRDDVDARSARVVAPEPPAQEMTQPENVIPEAPAVHPYPAWAAYCQAAGLDITSATEDAKKRGMSAIKRLLTAGYSSEDIGGCTAYLSSQSWRTNIISLDTLGKEIGPWKMAGRPAAEQSRASPSAKKPGGFFAAGQNIDEEQSHERQRNRHGARNDYNALLADTESRGAQRGIDGADLAEGVSGYPVAATYRTRS